MATASLLCCIFLSCSKANQEKSKEEAREDVRKTTAAVKRAGAELDADAEKLKKRVDAAVQPDSVSASEKLAHAEEMAKTSAAEAGVKIDDAALLAKVKAKLLSDAGLATLTRVDVKVNGGVVTLSGSVESVDQRAGAEKAASETPGVTQVRNELVVRP